MGVVDCDNMLILLGIPKDISDNERDVVATNFFDGFKVFFDCSVKLTLMEL